MAPPAGTKWFHITPPVRVQAVQLTEDADWEAIARWCGGELVNHEVGDSGERETVLYLNKHDDKVDRCAAWENSWIIKGVTGHFFTREHDEFIANYQPVDSEDQDRVKRRGQASVVPMRLVRKPEYQYALGSNATIIPVLLDDTILYLLNRFIDAETDAVFFVPAYDDGTVHFFRIERVTIPTGGEQP
jgi:hypothetical protein